VREMDGREIIANYAKWIKDNSFTRDVLNGKYIAITTPFLDRHNDHIEIYVTEKNGEFILSDDGETIMDLAFSGTDINTPKRKMLFEQTISGFGVRINKENNLYIKSDAGMLPQKKHALLQAILSVNDMYVLSHENVYSFFKEDLQNYLRDTLRIPFVTEVKLAGKSGYDHKIDFVLPKAGNNPPQLIIAINNINKNQIFSAAFSFSDIESLRMKNEEKIIVYNDEIAKINAEGENAFKQYGVKSLAWNDKNSIKESLAG
jgi:hypothetical protein